MKRRVNITYRWWRSGKQRIKPGHVEALEESAMTRIQEQMGQGNTSGELLDYVRMTDRDGEDGIEYHGHWEVVYTGE